LYSLSFKRQACSEQHLFELWQQSGSALPHIARQPRALLAKLDWARLDSHLRTKGL
jgi:hypothetical protein